MPNASVLIQNLFIREEAIGVKNNVNLEFTTSFKFAPGTLEVLLDGSELTPGSDFDELPNYQGFLIKLSDNINRLKLAPENDEDLRVKYIRS